MKKIADIVTSTENTETSISKSRGKVSFGSFKRAEDKQLKKIKDLGYKGIKIHPRFSQIDLIKDKDLIFENINFCGEHHLTVLFCTYFNDREKGFIIEKPGDYINDLLTSCKKIKIVLSVLIVME